MEENATELQDLQVLIDGIKTTLGAISRDSESRFVKTGEDLQLVYSDAERIGQRAMETTGMISGDEDNMLLTRIGELAKGSLSRLEAFTTEVSGLFPRFQSCIGHMKSLSDRCPGIVKIAKTLKMISMNISTESSRSKECEAMFGIFVDEIRGLALKVHDISHRINEDSVNSSTAQEAAFRRIMDQGNQLNLTADMAREMVSQNIERIDEVIGMSLQTLERSESHSQRISELVGEVVVAIQFHDIVRQQIEHVVEAMEDIEGLINGHEIPGLGTGTEGYPILMGKIHSIMRLQSSQVEQVITEIGEAHGKIAGAFVDIGSEIESLVNEVGHMGSDALEGSGREGAFNILLSGFERLERIMMDGESLTREIDGTVKRIRDSASGLSDYLSSIEDISDDLHIKSINALIMSKKLGTNGVTLSVLAQYVTDVSKGSDEFVREVINILKSIQSSAHELKLDSSKIDGTSGYRGATASSLRDGIDSVSLSYRGFLESADLSRNMSISLKMRIAEAGAGLDFLMDMKGNLERSLRDMGTLIDKLAPFALEGQGMMEDLSRVKSRYTMDIERGVHEKSMGRDEEYRLPEEKETRQEDDELGDNVELF